MATEPLDVWLHESCVGRLTRNRDGRLKLSYTDDAFDSFNANDPVLSCALPLTRRPQDATAFVDGLLPEGETRRQLAERARLPVHDMFGLIGRYGRDVAGAVQFLEPGAKPTDANYSIETLDNAKIAELVDELETNPLAIVDESELSLPGVQSKMLLVDLGGGAWGRPLGGRPSTHILKRDHQVHTGLVAAECDALALARYAGLSSFDARIERFGGYDCLIVERYDRRVGADGVVHRIHQEDACQALGMPSTQKYEIHHGGGGPELSQIAELLDTYSTDPGEQLDRLAASAVFTGLIGNADAHGKNVAFLLRDGKIELAPMFDTVPTVLWPRLRSEYAMTVGGSVTAVTPEGLAREARSWRHSEKSAVAAGERCAVLVLDALASGIVGPGLLSDHARSAANNFLDRV